MPDKTIVCQDCGQEFVFSESEQKFYEERGFQDPKRCKPCRDQRKAQRRSSGGRGGGGWGSHGRY
jgi:DNA replicative helicase MCM subunit Mcm2 (Cdc46/Mcm family)